jgi:hypothetical protein
VNYAIKMCSGAVIYVPRHSKFAGDTQCGMSGPVARRDNHVNFYNKYLLLLEEYTDGQEGRVCGNQ